MGRSRKGKPVDDMALRVKDPLQALILADSYDERFRPISLERPRCLIPLVNAPPLSYAIEFLSSAGVEEIFVFCTAHKEQIQTFLDASVWTSTPHLTIEVVHGPDCVSAGDALREMDARQLIHDDFILINGDVISNMQLESVLSAHQERRKKDKNAIMTMVFKEAAPHHRTRSLEDDLVVALDSASGQLLHYDNDVNSKAVELNLASFHAHRAIELRHDVIDTRIDICSPQVLHLFTDNFDYQELRRDFLYGIVSAEILGHQVHTHIIRNEYAARMKDLRTYASVSADIVHRWVFPMVPDVNWWLRPADGQYKLQRRSNYRDVNVSLHRTAVVAGGTVLGGGTTIGANSRLENCIVGRDCTIGENVHLVNCFLWSRVKVGDNVKATAVIMCDDVECGAGAVVGSGCVLSFGVKVAADFVLDPHTKVTLRELPSLESSFDDSERTEHISVGKGLSAFRWFAADPNDQLSDNRLLTSATGFVIDDVADEEGDKEDLSRAELRRASRLVHTEDDSMGSMDDALATDVLLRRDNRRMRSDSELLLEGVDAGIFDGGDSGDMDADTDFGRFAVEVVETVTRGFAEGHSVDNMALELAALKFAYDTSYLEIARAILPALICAPNPEIAKDGQALLAHAQAGIQNSAALLQKYMTSLDDQVDVIYTAQEVAEDDPVVAKLFPGLLHTLYDADVVSEQAILQWAKEQETADDKQFLTLSKPFLDWLASASEESEESDD